MSAGEHKGQSKAPGAISRFALRAQTDTRLVALAREGHDAAFEEIVRRYRTPLVRFASTIVPADAAEDAVQDGLIRAHRAMLADNNELALRAWLYTIVRNGAVSERRRIRPTEELDETINGVPQPPDIFERRERVRGVVAKLKELPEGQREALVRTELGGESAERIADSLGTSPAGVGQLVFRARAALRSGAAVILPMPVMRALLEMGSGATGATVVKVGAAVAVAAVAVGPGRTPVTDLEQPSAVDAGASRNGASTAEAEGTTSGHDPPQATHDSAASQGEDTGGGSDSSGKPEDRASSNESNGAASSDRSAGTASVALTSSPPDGGGSGGSSQGDDGHGGGASPPQDDDGDHGSGGAPPPPPPPEDQGSNGGSSWDGNSGGGQDDHGDHDDYGYGGSGGYDDPDGGGGYGGGGGGDGYGGGGGDHGGHH